MKKLDRLVWAAGISFRSHAVRVGVGTNTPELLNQVVAQLPVGWKFASSNVVGGLYSVIQGGTSTRSNARSFHILYADIERVERTENLDQLLESLVSDIETYIAQSTPQKLFIYAGVVAFKGRAMFSRAAV